MLVWSSKMYLDNKLSKRRKKYQQILEKNKLIREVYCITLPVNGENTMEIYSSRELWFQYYREKKLVVIGLAGTRESAQKLAAQICLDTVRRQGDISPALIQDYFQV
ncbi:MAG: hypothetical protein J5979_01405 [Lachnospiraceae bacterium]|nr:hypothetical protein [Lachnospiraceae bacterium]